MTPAPARPAFAAELRESLSRTPQREIPCSYLYDEVGSRLFEAITALREYGLTRADERILRRCAPEIVACLPSPLIVAELGSGSGRKTRSLLEALAAREPARYFPIDLSAAALEDCAREVRALGAVQVTGLEMSYAAGLEEAARRRAPGERLLVLFLGSTIGNLARHEIGDWFLEMRGRLREGDGLLVGADLVKPAECLIAAYDDPAGVTAAFNLNVLSRVNRELGANFDLRRFRHEARWNAPARRIEMHLRSLGRQHVEVPAAGLSFVLEDEETIWTESSHKFLPGELKMLADRAGFGCAGEWTDREWPFSESLFVARS
jgi:dimethylhistidine N-methyltransferase